MLKRKICAVTGNRAEYGHLYWILKEIEKSPYFELQLVATGMHLSPEFGLTYKVIEEDGFCISAKVLTVMSSDTAVGVASSIGLGVIGFGEVFERLKPDLVLLDGDRYELLAAVLAALVARIPVAHIGGGDLTECSYDEAIRHSLTKMSHMHFPTNEASARRIRQLGEDQNYIFNVGSSGIDFIKRFELLDRKELEEKLGFRFKEKNILITYHPVTLAVQPMEDQFQKVLNALDSLGSGVGLIFTKTNSDNEGRVINRMVDTFVAGRPHAKAFVSLGQTLYLSTLAQVDAIVGNSSSGLYEAPSFKVPTVNIGNRQKGRLCASSVINCLPRTEAVQAAIQRAFELDCLQTINPYGDGNTASKIVSILKTVPDFKNLLIKRFCDL